MKALPSLPNHLSKALFAIASPFKLGFNIWIAKGPKQLDHSTHYVPIIMWNLNTNGLF